MWNKITNKLNSFFDADLAKAEYQEMFLILLFIAIFGAIVVTAPTQWWLPKSMRAF